MSSSRKKHAKNGAGKAIEKKFFVVAAIVTVVLLLLLYLGFLSSM